MNHIKENYPKILLFIFIIVWLYFAISPRYRQIWFLENILTFLAIPFLILAYKKFRFSNLSYTLIFIILILHIIGSYYSYSEVPLFDLIKDEFNFTRNHYDRLVHFLFGFAFYFPAYEFVTKKFKISGFFSYFLVFLCIIGLKAIYEVITFGSLYITKNEVIGTNFLGMQGDQWDSHKDIFFGMVGALISWIIISLKKH